MNDPHVSIYFFGNEFCMRWKLVILFSKTKKTIALIQEK